MVQQLHSLVAQRQQQKVVNQMIIIIISQAPRLQVIQDMLWFDDGVAKAMLLA